MELYYSGRGKVLEMECKIISEAKFDYTQIIRKKTHPQHSKHSVKTDKKHNYEITIPFHHQQLKTVSKRHQIHPSLRPFSTKSPRKLHILRLNSNPLPMNSTQIRIYLSAFAQTTMWQQRKAGDGTFKQGDEICLNSLLQCPNCTRLKPQISLEVLRNLPHKALKSNHVSMSRNQQEMGGGPVRKFTNE
jgi:hypothetical protein